MDYFERINTIESALSELSGEKVLQYLTGWHGLQLLDKPFYDYLVDEGILPEEEEEEEEEQWEKQY
jgi:hypothetical protein